MEGRGHLEALLISKRTRWPPPLALSMQDGAVHNCLPLLNCGQKTVHPTSFLKYLHTPWGLLIFLSWFSIWYSVQGGVPKWH